MCTRMMVAVALSGVLICGCGSSADAIVDAELRDAVALDSTEPDSDAWVVDAAHMDGHPVDGDVFDAGDAWPVDAGISDAATADAWPVDADGVDAHAGGCVVDKSLAFAGDFQVTSAVDVTILNSYTAVLGELDIRYPDVTLPNLSYVGRMQVQDAPDAQLSFPALCRVQAGVSVAAAITSFDAPVLDSIGGGFATTTGPAGNVASVHIPALRTIGGGLGIRAVGASVFRANALESIGGGLRVVGPHEIYFPVLTTTGDVHVGERAPIAYPVSVLSVPSLYRVGHLHLEQISMMSLSLPALEEIHGGLDLLAAPGFAVLSTDSLRTIDGIVQITSQGALSTWSAVSLQSVGEMWIIANNSLASLNFPSLTTLTLPGTIIRNNPALTDIRMQALSAAQDLIVADHSVLQTIDLGSLASTTGPIRIASNPSLAALSLGPLVAGSDVEISSNHALTSLDIGAVVAVTGDLLIGDNTSLIALTANALTAVDGNLWIVANTSASSLAMSSLISLGGAGQIIGNSSLPTCQAEVVRDRLLNAGYTGLFTIAGNAAACP